jgi:hypothetical protein
MANVDPVHPAPEPPAMKSPNLPAILLGVGGLIPFLACTVAILFYPSEMPIPNLIAALTGYGAVILSFVGAVHWGLALAGDPFGVPARPAMQARRLVLGILPALVGWAALLLGIVGRPKLALLLLLLGFIATTIVETRAGRAGLMPRAYLGLRWLLSAVVILSLAAVLLARIV